MPQNGAGNLGLIDIGNGKQLDYELCSKFHSQNWYSLKPEEKMEAIRNLEMQIAAVKGRQPRTVKFEDLGTKRGRHNDRTKTITINLVHLKDTNRNNGNNMRLFHTIVHEGRHAYQRDAVANSVDKTRRVANDGAPKQQKWADKIMRWRENFRNYLRAPIVGFPRYRGQPVEMDANTYANKVVERVFQRLESNLGRDAGHTRYTEFCQGVLQNSPSNSMNTPAVPSAGMPVRVNQSAAGRSLQSQNRPGTTPAQNTLGTRLQQAQNQAVGNAGVNRKRTMDNRSQSQPAKVAKH